MANAHDTQPAPATNAGPSMEEAFLADRQTFWNRFTQFTTYSIVVLVLLLVGMYVFMA